jgi:manganese oxidase
MFTVVKVRDGLSREDYGDPGWFKHPPGTVAYEWQGENQASSRVPSAARSGASSTEFQVIKPGSNKHNNH